MPPRAMPANPDFSTAYRKPMFNFGINIGQRLMIMDPDDPLRYQTLARINLGADLGRDWYLRSSVALNIYNDWDTITRKSDSVLPRVRSEIRQYLSKGKRALTPSSSKSAACSLLMWSIAPMAAYWRRCFRASGVRFFIALSPAASPSAST